MPELVYLYHLTFKTATATLSLSAAIDNYAPEALAYPPYNLPSFSLPPWHLNNLG